MSLQNTYFFYMLKCWKNKKAFEKRIPKHGHVIYTGYTENIARRMYQHLTGKKFTRRPTFTSQFKGMLVLGYLEAYTTKKEAKAREAEFKFPNIVKRDVKIKMMQDLLPDEIEIISHLNKNVLKMIKVPLPYSL